VNKQGCCIGDRRQRGLTIGLGDIEHATHEYSDDTDDSTRAMEVCLWQERGGCHHHHLKLAEGQQMQTKFKTL
jgi:hypothetical protein